MASADVPLAANATAPGVNLELLRQILQNSRYHRSLMEFNNDTWWMMPHDRSDAIVEQWLSGPTKVSFVWDWHGARRRSYRPGEAQTDINRYIIDFTTMQQRNTDNNNTRNVRVVCLIP